jgi:hypothetical protein
MSTLVFGGRDDPNDPLPWYYNPNIFFRDSDAEPDSTPNIPTFDRTTYIWCSVKNVGQSPIVDGKIEFFWSLPNCRPSPGSSTWIGESTFDLNPGETANVACHTPWLPQVGHECVICQVFPQSPPPGFRTDTTPWAVDSVRVAQHNLDVSFPSIHNSGLRQPLITSLLAEGLQNDQSTSLSVRVAPSNLLAFALKETQLDRQFHRDAGPNLRVGLVADYACGDPLPDITALEPTLQLNDLKAGRHREAHLMIEFPEGALDSSAALFFVEQLDRKGNIVGGVAILALSSRIQSFDPVTPAASAPSIPVSIPSRPYATLPAVGTMMLDGLFVTNLAFQFINAETRNDSTSTLDNVSIYIEGFSDPNIVLTSSHTTITGNRILPSPTVSKAVFAADFMNATPGETRVAFVVQQNDSASTKKVRIIKKIFVFGGHFDPTSKIFTTRVPQGTFELHVNTIITAEKESCNCDPDGQRPQPDPVLIRRATLTWTPSSPYPGTHGPLPFDDPWTKVLEGCLAVVLVIAALASFIFCRSAGTSSSGGGSSTEGSPVGTGGSPSSSPEGVADSKDPTAHCTNCQSGSLGISVPLWIALLAGGVITGIIAYEQDESDLFDRGRIQTVPEEGELTTSEVVHYSVDYHGSPSPGTPFGGRIEWDYTRTLDSGRTLTHHTTDDWQNIHFLKERTLMVDGVHKDDGLYDHLARRPLNIAAKFASQSGELYKGSSLYVVALLRLSTSKTERFIELRDQGDEQNGIEPNSGTYSGDFGRIQAGTYYLLVFAQNVNNVPEGTEPRKAAQTIGGMLLTDQFKLGLNGSPCALHHDAVITSKGLPG